MARNRESKGFRLPIGHALQERLDDMERRLQALEAKAAEPTCDPEKLPLVTEALELKLGARSVLERWSPERLAAEIAKAKAKA